MSIVNFLCRSKIKAINICDLNIDQLNNEICAQFDLKDNSKFRLIDNQHK